MSHQVIIIRFLAILVLVISIAIFYDGFHNIDNAQNLRTANEIAGYEMLQETSIAGNPISYSDAYIRGLENMFVGFTLIVLSNILFISGGDLLWQK